MRHILDRLNSVPVLLSKDFQTLPPIGDISPFYVKEMNMNSQEDVRKWLETHNDAFERTWGPDQFQRNVLNHAYFDIDSTFFLMHGSEAAGAGSIGVFRKNRDVGVMHYLQVKKTYQGRGLGKYMVQYRHQRLRERGIEHCETEMSLRQKISILIHFDNGFRPKYKLDYWNAPNHAFFPYRVFAHFRLRQLYNQWEKSRRFAELQRR